MTTELNALIRDTILIWGGGMLSFTIDKEGLWVVDVMRGAAFTVVARGRGASPSLAIDNLARVSRRARGN